MPRLSVDAVLIANAAADHFGPTLEMETMRIDGQAYRSIWFNKTTWTAHVIDQTLLPHRFEIRALTTLEHAAIAISTMQVRGAPLIGATAAYGVALAMRHESSDRALDYAVTHLARQRPTAVNLAWALDQMQILLQPLPPDRRASAAIARAIEISEQDVEACRSIGQHGLQIVRDIAADKPKGQPVNILTHCNAGWLACVDWGTATAPIYQAHDAGLRVHVWVDETRPRNQGAALTTYELGGHGVPHTLITDNAGGHLMQLGLVDLVLVGADRVTSIGDVANKIGTYLKALAAHDNRVPFYVALPQSTIDWSLSEGADIPIEERSAMEVLQVSGRLRDGTVAPVDIAPIGTKAFNPAFDITPARLINGFITERGICAASRDGLLSLYPEHRTSPAGETLTA
jgi:methylthioribose-1-phosphate isomerase